MCAANASGGTLVILPAQCLFRDAGVARHVELSGVWGLKCGCFIFYFPFHCRGDALAMLPVMPIRRCGGGGARGLEWCAEVVTVVVSFFEFSISG